MPFVSLSAQSEDVRGRFPLVPEADLSDLSNSLSIYFTCSGFYTIDIFFLYDIRDGS